MPRIILKIIPALILWGIFIFIVLNVPYPESITQASFVHIALFFISLYLALAFTFSTLISLGLIILLFLQALDSLNVVTGILTIIAIGLFISYFKKIKRKNLTKLPKIPKLTSLQRNK